MYQNNKKIFDSGRYHKSGIKALSWCPSNSNKFVSGGGTADKTIKIWNLIKNNNEKYLLGSSYTNDQVCYLNWSENNNNEIVSTHGYTGNKINVWRINNDKDEIKIQNIKQWKGHDGRILHATMNAYGDQLITGCSYDEYIKFWRIYSNNIRIRDSKYGIYTYKNTIR